MCHNLWQVLERMPMPLFSQQRAHAAGRGFSREWLYVLPFSKGRFEHAYVHMSLLSICTVLYAYLATDDSQTGSLRRRRRRRGGRRAIARAYWGGFCAPPTVNGKGAVCILAPHNARIASVRAVVPGAAHTLYVTFVPYARDIPTSMAARWQPFLDCASDAGWVHRSADAAAVGGKAELGLMRRPCAASAGICTLRRSMLRRRSHRSQTCMCRWRCVAVLALRGGLARMMELVKLDPTPCKLQLVRIRGRWMSDAAPRVASRSDMIIMMGRCDTARNAATKPFVSKALHARVSSSQTLELGAGSCSFFSQSGAAVRSSPCDIEVRWRDRVHR